MNIKQFKICLHSNNLQMQIVRRMSIAYVLSSHSIDKKQENI